MEEDVVAAPQTSPNENMVPEMMAPEPGSPVSDKIVYEDTIEPGFPTGEGYPQGELEEADDNCNLPDRMVGRRELGGLVSNLVRVWHCKLVIHFLLPKCLDG